MIRESSPAKAIPLLLLLALLFVCGQANATPDPNVVNEVLTRFQGETSQWADRIFGYASWLFWTLSVISLVWTFAFMLFRRADFGEVFAELIRFIMFTGLFWWILTSAAAFQGGDGFIMRLVNSLRQIGGEVTDGSTVGTLNPHGIVQVGLEIFANVVEQSTVWPDALMTPGFILATMILVALALVGIIVMLTLISAWVLAFGGIFLLGFGGLRWTSEIAINYYRQALAVALSLLAMIIVLYIGQDLLDDYHREYGGTITFNGLAVMLVVSLALLALIYKIPSLLANIVTGSRLGMASGVAGMTVNAVAAGGAAIAAGAAGAGSQAQSLMAAYGKASEYSAGGDASRSPMPHGAYGETGVRGDSRAAVLSESSVFEAASAPLPPAIHIGGTQVHTGAAMPAAMQSGMAAADRSEVRMESRTEADRGTIASESAGHGGGQVQAPELHQGQARSEEEALPAGRHAASAMGGDVDRTLRTTLEAAPVAPADAAFARGAAGPDQVSMPAGHAATLNQAAAPANSGDAGSRAPSLTETHAIKETLTAGSTDAAAAGMPMPVQEIAGKDATVRMADGHGTVPAAAVVPPDGESGHVAAAAAPQGAAAPAAATEVSAVKHEAMAPAAPNIIAPVAPIAAGANAQDSAGADSGNGAVPAGLNREHPQEPQRSVSHTDVNARAAAAPAEPTQMRGIEQGRSPDAVAGVPSASGARDDHHPGIAEKTTEATVVPGTNAAPAAGQSGTADLGSSNVTVVAGATDTSAGSDNKPAQPVQPQGDSARQVVIGNSSAAAPASTVSTPASSPPADLAAASPTTAPPAAAGNERNQSSAAASEPIDPAAEVAAFRERGDS